MSLPSVMALPGLGVGKLRFGMSRADVHSFWGKPTEEGSRGSGYKCELFADRLCYIYFDRSGEVEAFEFGRGGFDVVCDGVSLFAISGPELKRWVTSRDQSVEERSGGFVSWKLGLYAYAPLLNEEPGDPVEGVTLFRPGAMAMRDI